MSRSIAICLMCFSAASGADLGLALRRPVALAPAADSNWLYVANRDSGSLSVIDLKSSQVVAERKIGRRLSDIAIIPGSSCLLATDEVAHELLLLETSGSQAEVVQRLAISPYPVSISIASDGKSAAIASLWSRRLTFVDLEKRLVGISRVVDLPFAPRSQLVHASGERLLVADAFGGKFALINPQ